MKYDEILKEQEGTIYGKNAKEQMDLPQEQDAKRYLFR